MGLEVDLAAFVDDRYTYVAPREHDGSALSLVRRCADRIDVVGDVDRLLHVRETLVVAAGGIGHQSEVFLGRGRVTVVAGSSMIGRLPDPCRGVVGLGRVAEEDVGDIAVVAAVDGGISGHLGAMRHVVRRGTFQYGFQTDGSADEVVHDYCPG